MFSPGAVGISPMTLQMSSHTWAKSFLLIFRPKKDDNIYKKTELDGARKKRHLLLKLLNSSQPWGQPTHTHTHTHTHSGGETEGEICLSAESSPIAPGDEQCPSTRPLHPPLPYLSLQPSIFLPRFLYLSSRLGLFHFPVGCFIKHERCFFFSPCR